VVAGPLTRPRREASAAGLGAALAARVGGHAERVVPILPFDRGPDGRPTNGVAWDSLIEAVRQVP
jgi:hypothetical protein